MEIRCFGEAFRVCEFQIKLRTSCGVLVMRPFLQKPT